MFNVYKILDVFNRLILRFYNNFYILSMFIKYHMFGKKIVLKYGFDKLGEIAKMNFKNTEKIKEN